MPTVLAYLGFLSLPVSSYGSICIGNMVSPNWYGTAAYPPYFTRDVQEKCPQEYPLSRCEQSAVMKDGTSNFTINDSGAEVCAAGVDCFPTKMNCNDTLSCSNLVKLKDELMEGGHNIVCRHEKSYWQQYTGETKNCQLNADCLDPDVKQTQRQLQPFGWKSGSEFASSFHEMGIPIGKTFSSPLTRCAQHAELFSDEPNEERLELLYMASWLEVLTLNNINGGKSDAIKWQAYNLRNFAGKKPSPGQNNVMVTHGFNIKLAFGTAVDEGYCMVLKPEDSEPSLADSFGSLTVADREFVFDDDSFPVNAIARMSPESALLMQTCDDARIDAIGVGSGGDDLLASIDANHDMKITREEFMSSFLGPLDNGGDAFHFIRSVILQPQSLGAPENDEEPAIELGQFFHINWGWREFLTSGGDILYPWRFIIDNSIGPLGLPTPEERVAAFKQANNMISNLVDALKDQSKYPTIVQMEDKLIDCNKDPGHKSKARKQNSVYNTSMAFMEASAGLSYYHIGAGDGGAGALSGDSIFGSQLAYPAEWKPDQFFHESRLAKVAKCLVQKNKNAFN